MSGNYLYPLDACTVSLCTVSTWCAVMGAPLVLVSDIEEASGLLLAGGTDADLRAAARAVAEVDKPLFWIGDGVVVRFDSPQGALETAHLLGAGRYERPQYAHNLRGISVFVRTDDDACPVTPIGIAAQQAGVRISDLPYRLQCGLWEAWQEEAAEMESGFIEWATAEIQLAMETRHAVEETDYGPGVQVPDAPIG